MPSIAWSSRGRWPANVLLCALLTTLSYPISEDFARQGIEVTVTIEQCNEEIQVKESFSALDQVLGTPRVGHYPLGPRDDGTPHPEPECPVPPH